METVAGTDSDRSRQPRVPTLLGALIEWKQAESDRPLTCIAGFLLC